MKSHPTLLIVRVAILILAACTIFIVRRPQPQSLSSALPHSLPSNLQHNAVTAEPRKLFAETSREPISPFVIKRYITQHQTEESVSLQEFWQRLGIKGERWQEGRKCQAHIFRLQLDNEPGPEVVLRLHVPFPTTDGDTRYLIFTPRKAGHQTTWKFLGLIDLSGQLRVPPQRIISIGGRHWFVLNTLAGRGSGFSLYKDVWYEVNHQGVKPVLSYPSWKFLGVFPDLQASSRLLSTKFESGQPRVTVRFSVRYSWYEVSGQDYTLWSKRQVASFIKPRNSGEFVLDPRRSNVSERELYVIYGDEGMIPAEILKYNYPSLVKLATGREGKAKRWLRTFLRAANLSDAPEARRLKQLLSVE
jgi:hypothetical protein